MPTIERSLLANSFGERLLGIFASKGLLCIGLDPSVDQLQKWGLPQNAAGAEKFCNLVLDACHDSVGIVKPQVSFFEQFGSDGFSSLERVLRRAADEGLLVIVDAKRGDIGSTMDGYARAWLTTDAPFYADALTVSPFLGPTALGETAAVALQNGKGLFVLAATSNPEARSLQLATDESGDTVTASIFKFASGLNQEPLGSIGVVVGAQASMSTIGNAGHGLDYTPILAPGFGAQGARLSDANKLFGGLATTVIYNVGRSVAGESSEGLKNRILEAKLELETGLST